MRASFEAPPKECNMQVSRRDFLRLSLGAGSGTALAGLVASGVNLAPAVA
ncbi:MAG: twin-arginine translocation signal domain-containing protein, partial [Burkholderiales bacterium]